MSKVKTCSIFLLLAIVSVLFISFFISFTYACESPECYIEKQDDLNLSSSKYHRSLLQGSEKEAYDAIEDAMRSYKQKVALPIGTDPDRIEWIYVCVLNDNPDIFWVSNIFYWQGNLFGVAGIDLTYLFDKDEAISKAYQYRQKAKDVVEDIKKNSFDGSQSAVALGIYSWIAANTEYQEKDVYDQHICSVFDDGKTICAGYAKTYKYMCDIAEIPCLCVFGSAKMYEGDASETHIWDVMYADGKTMYVDPTWGDYGDFAELKWFDTSNEKFLSTHTAKVPELDFPSFN